MTARKTETSTPSPAPSIRILVVDDDKHVIELHELLLDEKGFEIIGASNPFLALEMCREESFDLVISDFEMPGLDGFEFARRIEKEHGTKFPFIFSTQREDDPPADVPYHSVLRRKTFKDKKPFKINDYIEDISTITGRVAA